jgi:hypothetical protein
MANKPPRLTVKPKEADAVGKKWQQRMAAERPCAVSYTQENVLCAMLDHKLIWRKRDNACVLTCGEAPEKRVRRATVQTLLNQRLILGPFPSIEKPLYDFWYKLSPTGKDLALYLT